MDREELLKLAGEVSSFFADEPGYHCKLAWDLAYKVQLYFANPTPPSAEGEYVVVPREAVRLVLRAYQLGAINASSDFLRGCEMLEKSATPLSTQRMVEPTEAMIDAAWAELQRWSICAGEWQKAQAASILRAALSQAPQETPHEKEA